MSAGAESELVFALSISSFTRRGYIGSASLGGKPVDLEFDDADAGAFLTAEMLQRLGAKVGSKVLLVVEADEEPVTAETIVSKAAKARISNARVYYEVGREGGAILRIRKA